MACQDLILDLGYILFICGLLGVYRAHVVHKTHPACSNMDLHSRREVLVVWT